VTTSTEMTRAEIERFLRGGEPKVLCVTGEYGVGKTFLWRSVLDRLRKEKGLSFERYSYVSLFGLTSLDDLKSSLFENMEWLDEDPDQFVSEGNGGCHSVSCSRKEAFGIGRRPAGSRSVLHPSGVPLLDRGSQTRVRRGRTSAPWSSVQCTKTTSDTGIGFRSNRFRKQSQWFMPLQDFDSWW
jgi:hypothetical protein